MCIGAGACSGAFLFLQKLFSGKAQDATRGEMARECGRRNDSTTYGGVSYLSFYISNLKDLVA